MSISTISVIMGRIKSATETSPIAVFKPTDSLENEDGERMLDAVFGATIATKQQIDDEDENFIGLFHKDMDLENVEAPPALIADVYKLKGLKKAAKEIASQQKEVEMRIMLAKIEYKLNGVK